MLERKPMWAGTALLRLALRLALLLIMRREAEASWRAALFCASVSSVMSACSITSNMSSTVRMPSVSLPGSGGRPARMVRRSAAGCAETSARCVWPS
jgi:hypothetical protein